MFLVANALSQSGSWTLHTFGSADVNDICFVDSLNGWIVGDSGKVYNSTDGGVTWALQGMITTNSLRAVFFVNRNVGFAAGNMNSKTLFTTTNGGVDWDTINSLPDWYTKMIHFIDDSVGYILTSPVPYGSMNAKQTTDGGHTWTALANDVTDLNFTDSLHGFLCKSSGSVWYTTDGRAWTYRTGTSQWEITKISFPTDSIGYSFCYDGVSSRYLFLKTTTGGSTWDTVATTLTGSMSSLYFADSVTGWLVGSLNNNALILRTTDGGSTWENDFLLTPKQPTYSMWMVVRFFNRFYGWALGLGSEPSENLIACYKLIQGVGVNTGSEIPGTFSLQQNYPNPFNPATSINYSLPVRSHVTMKIYNVLGKEIATLVDETQAPGDYTVPWNAANVPSGIYFVQVIAGQYSQMQKVVLVK